MVCGDDGLLGWGIARYILIPSSQNTQTSQASLTVSSIAHCRPRHGECTAHKGIIVSTDASDGMRDIRMKHGVNGEWKSRHRGIRRLPEVDRSVR